MSASPPPPPRPFFTRASTLGWSATCIAAYLLYEGIGYVAGNSTGAVVDRGPAAAGLALAASVFAVSWLVAWIGGIVLALRSRSIGLTFVAVLPVPPMNAIFVALMVRSADAAPPRSET